MDSGPRRRPGAARSPGASPPPLRGRVCCGSSVVQEGLFTRAQLRSSAWRRLYPDVYACAGLEVTHTVRAVAVTRLLLPGAVASGRTAAALWGVDARTPEDDVEVTVPPACRGGAVPASASAGGRCRRVVFVTAADLRRPAQLLARVAAELAAPRSA